LTFRRTPGARTTARAARTTLDWSRARADMTIERYIIRKVKFGIVGAGGSGFRKITDSELNHAV
jgi:hypothetical protein